MRELISTLKKKRKKKAQGGNESRNILPKSSHARKKTPPPPLPIMPAGMYGSNEASPSVSVTGQPLDGAPAVVHVLSYVVSSGERLSIAHAKLSRAEHAPEYTPSSAQTTQAACCKSAIVGVCLMDSKWWLLDFAHSLP